MNSQTLPHIVLAGVEAWGHARPLCIFAARVALIRDVQITLFTTPRILERVKAEVARGFGPEEAERQKLIRVIAIDNVVEGLTGFADIMNAERGRYITSFTAVYERLVQQQPVVCAVTKQEFSPLSSPKLLIIDFMVGSIACSVSHIKEHQAKIVGFCSGMVSFIYVSFAPVARGGQADFKEKVLNEAQVSGRPVGEVAEEIISVFTDRVYQMPGFPKMYHWEFDSQDVKHLIQGMVGQMWMSFFDSFEACDGMILTSAEAYEPQAITAMKEWFAETSRPVWAVGPLLPSIASQEAIAGEEASSPNFKELTSFLNSTLESHGPHSVLFISFGSVFWPLESDKLEAFVDVVIEKNIPFILSTGSPVAQLSDRFKNKIESYSLGVLSRWSPQQTILANPALGWFVTHGGHNSTLEAIHSGVPMICWPFHADQPANAVNLTDNHDVAFELFEVRTGNGLKPIYRMGKAPTGTLEAVRSEAREVLGKAFGEDGAKKRANMNKLKATMSVAWEMNGPAYVEMQKLLDGAM